MNNLLAFLFGFLFINVQSQTSITTDKKLSSYSKHGITITDDYSWLEKIPSEATTKWVENQNAITESHLKEVRKKYNFEKKIKEYNELKNRSLPQKKGKYYYSEFYTGENKTASLFYRKKLNEEPIEILNLSKLLKNDNVLLGDYYPSKSSSLIAYSISLNGSDKTEIRFIDIHKNEDLPDIINDVKFSDAAWNLDLGVFYKKNINLNRIAADSTNQLCYHKIGTKQSEDKLIFDNTKEGTFFRHYTTRGKLIVIEENKDETKTNFYQASLIGEDFVLNKFFEDKTGNIKFLDYRNGQIYYSSKAFDWGEIRSFSIDKPEEETVIVPQIYSQLLVTSHFTEEYIFCRYKSIGKNCIRVYDPTGKFIRKFDTPDGFEFRISFYDKESNSLFVTMNSYAYPSVNYKLNIETGEIIQYYNEYLRAKPSIFPLDYFETKNITFKSRDNKDVPITIVYKKGIALDGKNPTLLSAYGGFGSVSAPNFSSGLLCFLSNGGIFAFAEIRGGGEKGLKWENDGKNLKKMNSFNDFIDAAEYLVKEKYTSPNKLAINGGSYGGLVVGVALTKRPDLFKLAIPEMGAFDMVKFDQFTVGVYHLNEFGNPEKKEEFDNLLSYSPYHNIDDKVNYPTTLIITSDNDDRVPPLHSFKFAAKLQNRESQKNPIYLKMFDNAGHYGKVSTYDKYVKSEADFYGFLLYHLNN